MAVSQADKAAQQLGYPSAAAYAAYMHQRELATQQSVQQAMPKQWGAPTQAQPAPAQPQSAHPWLDAIMQYLPLGSVNKAGKAMNKQ